MDFARLRSAASVIPSRKHSVTERFRSHSSRPGLELKLILIVIGVTLLGVFTSSALVLTLQRQQLVETTQAAITRLSNTLEASLEHAMMDGDRTMLSQIVQTMVSREGVEHVRIVDMHGRVQVSSIQTEIGSHFAQTDPACQLCHAGVAKPNNRTTLFTSPAGDPVLLNVNLIHNSPRCQACHDARDQVLGIMMFETPLSDLNDQINAAFWRMGLAALLTMSLLVALMLVDLRKLVIRPVSELTKGMTEIRAGNLDYAIQASSYDELGDLAEAFDTTRKQLKASRDYNALLLEETSHREQETITLYRLMMKISSSLEIAHVLDAIAEAAREILEADIGAVGLVDDKRSQIAIKACVGNRTRLWKSLRIPARDLFPKNPTPVAIEEWTPDLPIPHIAELIAQEGIVSSLAAPMWYAGHFYGFVGIMTRQRRHFSKAETQLFTRLVLQVVVAIENADLYKQVRYMATLEERDRLAREMHDDLAQKLGYLNFKTWLADDQLAKDQTADARASLLELKRITNEAYTDVRETIFCLRTTVSSGGGLVSTLREYLAEYGRQYGIAAQLTIGDERLAEFPAEVEIQVNRIIQEALSNVRKHSGASQAWVRFERAEPYIRISIEDNGRGFAPARSAEAGLRHFGLEIMRERAASVGGNVEITSQPNSGTLVILRVPILSAM